MPSGLRRFQQSGQSHFLTFSCYRRQANLSSPGAYDLFVQCLEDMRRRFAMCIYGYVVMPEYVHLLVNEPQHATLADAIHFLKLSFASGLVKEPGAWKWSSFRHYALGEIGIIEIESAWTAMDRETNTKGGPAPVFLNPG
jgi:REP-associated tyrosine transposase